MEGHRHELGVAIVGYAFMGAAHSQAWSTAHRVFDLPLRPVMRVMVGRDEGAVAASAARLGWADSETHWRALLDRPDVDVVDICTPGDAHAEIATAALDARIAGFRRVLVTEPEHPYLAAWWPTGHIVGWEHTFTHQVADFVTAVAAGDDPSPSFAEGLQLQQVLSAVEDSARNECRWTAVEATVPASIAVAR